MSSIQSSGSASAPSDNDTFFTMMLKMLSGQLDEGETELLFMLMEQSDENIETADALWAEYLATLDEAPPLDSERVKRIASMIEKRIYQADFSSELFRIGMQGVPNVWLALLKPLLSPQQQWDNKTQNHTGDENHGQ